MRKIIEKKGITLIALVITIIVMLILAGVTINLVLNENNGIFGIAQKADKENSKQTATEKMNLKITNSQMTAWAETQRMPTLQELADDFCEDDEIQYVSLASKKVASLEKIEVGENTSIFTKLKDYPYEFEINSSLQLASIDGVNVTTDTETQTQMRPFVLGSIMTKDTSSTNCAGYGYSSDEEYFTVSGSTAINYLTVNVLKDVKLKIMTMEAGRGTATTRTIYINDVAKDTWDANIGSNHIYEVECVAGDVIKIVATRSTSGRAVAVFMYAE